jgi:hypothetical protein
MKPDIINAAIAFSALVVSLISLFKTVRYNARQTELAATTERLNKILIERETAEAAASKKADLSANIYKSGKSDYRVKIFNRGRGVARNVRVEDLNPEEDSILIQSEIGHKFPVPILEQHQSVELIAAITLGSPLRAHIKLLWDDATGQDQEKELTPSL